MGSSYKRPNPQQEIAKRSGFSESSVSRWLRGKRRPRVDTAVKLAEAMGVTVEELLKQLPGRPA